MSNPVDLDPTDEVLPLPETKTAKKPDGDVPTNPNPYMGGGGTPP